MTYFVLLALPPGEEVFKFYVILILFYVYVFYLEFGFEDFVFMPLISEAHSKYRD